MTYLSAKNAGFTGSFNDWVAAGRPSGGSAPPPPDTPPPPETPTYTAGDYQKQLQGLGYGSGTLKSLQGIIGGLGTKTAKERLHKKKSQEALSGFSKASGKTSFYDNPFLETSSDQVWKDIQASQEKLFSEYEDEKTDLEKQIEFMNLRDERAYEKARKQGHAAVSSATAQFAQGREGAVSTTNPLIASKFGKSVQTQLDTASRQLNLAQDQRAKQMERLDKALEQGNEDLAASISESLADVGHQIQNIQQNLANAQAQNTQTAFDFLENSPAGTFEGMTTEDIMSMTGVDVGTANYMRVSDAKKATIELNDPDRIYKLAQINKMDREAQWAGMTNDSKNFATYQQLLQTNPEQAKIFAQGAGFIDDPTALEMAKVAEINAKMASEYYNENGSSLPINSKYSYTTVGNGVSWTGLESDSVCGTRWQCGEVTNDALGKPNLFGNSYDEKMGVCNSTTPVAGGAFVQKTSQWTGHVGLIESINPDGSMNVVESNYRKDEQGNGLITRTIIRPGDERYEQIKGMSFYAPQGGGKLNPKQLTAANKLAKDLYGSSVLKSEGGREAFLNPIIDRLKGGENIDEIADSLRFQSQSTQFTGSIRDASQQITSNYTDKKTQVVFDKLDDLLDKDDVGKIRDYLRKIARDNAGTDEKKQISGSERTIEFLNEIQNDLNILEDSGIKTNIFTGSIERIIGKAGAVKNKDMRKVATKIATSIQKYRRSMSGVAFSVPESIEYKELFPSISKTGDFNKSNIEALKQVLSGDVSFFYRNQMGEDSYNELFEGTNDKIKVDENIENEMWQESQKQNENNYFDNLN